MKSTTDKPVNLERAAGVSGEGWGVRIEQVTPERDPLALEILDRLERKTIEAERHHAAVLRLEGDLADAREEARAEASRAAQLACENGAAKVARGHAKAALARVRAAPEAAQSGSAAKDVLVVELGAAVRELEAAVAS